MTSARSAKPVSAGNGTSSSGLPEEARGAGRPRSVAEDERRYREAESWARFHKEALDHAAIVAVTDTHGTIFSVNGKFCEISGYSEDELIGSNHRILKSGRHDRAFFVDLYKTIVRGDVWHGEICNRAKSGKLYWVDTTIVAHRGLDGRIESYTSIRFDITRQKQAEEHLWRLANLDPLTGLPNRLKFMRDLHDVIGGSGARGIAVALLDLDHFKDINDSFGHDVGDRLLENVAARLRTALPSGDLVARLGGDEFAMILRDCPDGEGGQARLARVLDALRPSMVLSTTEHRLSASLGVARFPSGGNDVGELLKNADIALYVAKSQGRDRVEVFSDEMRFRTKRRIELRARVEKGLRTDEFRVHYQPIVPLDGAGSGAAVNFEALIRWHHPCQGLLPPGRFMEALSDPSLAAAVGDFVLAQVLADMGRWKAEGLPFGFIAVNTTLGDFRADSFVDRIVQAIASAQIETPELCIEITEDMLIGRGGSRVLQQIERIERAGLRIALDDFGTGFASLTHLRDLPIDHVKIDRGFVSSLGVNQKDRAIVTGVIGLAHSLGMTVTAEGVETAEQLAFLAGLGCDRVQGYLVAPALAAEDVPAFVGDWQGRRLVSWLPIPPAAGSSCSPTR